MGKPLVDRIPFAKILLGLVAVFVLSLGSCGATLVFGGSQASGNLVGGLVVAEIAGMALSAIGLVVTAILWVTLSVIGSSQEKVSQPQKLFADDNVTKLDKDE